MKILLVCEGDGDDEDLVTLTLRVLHEAHPWLRGLETGDQPTPEWIRVDSGARILKWADIEKVCDAYQVPRVHGLGMRLGARVAERLTRLLSGSEFVDTDDALRVLLVHDDDHVEGWRDCLERVRTQWRSRLEDAVRLNRRPPLDAEVTIGIATPEHESWVLTAFEPVDDDDRSRLAELRQALGFDPRLRGERLTSGRDTDLKNAKRVLRALCPDLERRHRLFAAASIEQLRERGDANGLRPFLDEVLAHIASAY